jgi:hypothetical protein
VSVVCLRTVVVSGVMNDFVYMFVSNAVEVLCVALKRTLFVRPIHTFDGSIHRVLNGVLRMKISKIRNSVNIRFNVRAPLVRFVVHLSCTANPQQIERVELAS